MGQPMTMMTIAKKYDAVVSNQRRDKATPPSTRAIERNGSAFRKVIRESSHEESPASQSDSPLKFRRRPSKKVSTSTDNASPSFNKTPSSKKRGSMSFKENTPTSLRQQFQRGSIHSFNNSTERTESDMNEVFDQNGHDVTDSRTDIPGSRKMSRKTKNIILTQQQQVLEINNNNEHEFFKPIKKDYNNHVSTPIVNGGAKRNSRPNVLNGHTDNERIPVIYEPSISSSNDSLTKQTNIEKNNNRKNERKKKISNSSITSSSSDVEKKTTPKKDFLSTEKKPQSYTPNIVEFDRSDMSSDSEPESTRNISSRRRLRSTLSRYSRSSIEEEQRRALQNKTPPVKEEEEIPANKPKRRRFGVSAEPVRVSWSTLRESLKTTEMGRTTEEVNNSNNDSTAETTNVNGDDNNTDTNTDTNQCENEGDEFSIQNKKVSVPSLERTISKTEIKPTEIPIIEIIPSEGTEMETKTDTPNVDLPNPAETEKVDGEPPSTTADGDKEETKEDSASNENEAEKPTSPTTPSTEETIQVTPNKIPVPAPPTPPNPNSLQIPPTNIYNDRCPFPLSSVAPSDLEKKYRTLVISYKTDQYTLPKRLENQERARDVAEAGMDKELCKLTSTIEELKRMRDTTELEDAWTSMLKQVEVLRKAAIKVSSQSEQHGSYQQEKRASPSIELIISYAENLRANVNKLEEELERVRRNPPPPTLNSPDNLAPLNRRESKHLNGLVPIEARNRALSDVTHDPDEKTKVLSEKMRSQSIKDVSTALLSQRRTSKRTSRASLSARSRLSLSANRRDLSRVSFIEESEYDFFKRQDDYDRFSLRSLPFFDHLADNTFYFVLFLLAIMLFGYFLITHIGVLTGTNLKDIVVEYVSYTGSFMSDNVQT